jgi:cobalt/nickel transport system permease protein
MVESAFMVVICLGTLFRGGGEVLWRWGSLQITTLGLTILGSVTCKALLCLVLLNLLTLTIPIPELLNALLMLRVPPLLVSIFAAMYRYLGVLMDEFTTMQRAATARNFHLGRPAHYRLVLGHLIGSLFIRTCDRGERIHQAMLARGYTGIPTPPPKTPWTTQERFALTLTTLLTTAGQLLPFLPLHR